MKQKYITPEIKTEVLVKTDVLSSSRQRDNRYIKSQDIFKGDYSIENLDIL